MKLEKVAIRNFRRLENVEIEIEDTETLFVGPNNSGKTSATAAFRCFLGNREFKIHDFSMSSVPKFNEFSDTENRSILPEIQLDLWFSIDPESIAFGRVFALLPNLEDLTRVGVRLSYGIEDATKLLQAYSSAYPAEESGKRAKSLFQFLGMDNNLRKHTRIQYQSLEIMIDHEGVARINPTSLTHEEGSRLVKELLQVDFVDAQRNINDEDSSRSNKLSAAFAEYYKKNLAQPEFAADAHEVIDRNNNDLTSHYEIQFRPLIELIQGLGIPAVNDRSLRLISSLSAESALRGNTELLYIDPKNKHELPELYNGLGFKNLIYMAIQVQHFYIQWLNTAKSRPLCLLIFIEEPEVHLHAQVQQTFINNILSVIRKSVPGDDLPMPQIAVTTHSSHILEAVDFDKVRYFQRSSSEESDDHGAMKNATCVHSLRSFKTEADVDEGAIVSPEEARRFLKKYLRLTHCDLFFADAVILVEGSVEKLLLPTMIDRVASGLRNKYLSVLEVGGAYAHRFEGLLSFLHIPYLIITDLDSVESGSRSKCRADTPDAKTSNACLKRMLGLDTIAGLKALEPSAKISTEKDRCIAFQVDTRVEQGNETLTMSARTIEEAIVFENFALARSGKISIGTPLPLSLSDAYQAIYSRIKSDSFKKTDFAIRLLAMEESWIVPAYIAAGLQWLQTRLEATAATLQNSAPQVTEA